jgi:hypothetical protein
MAAKNEVSYRAFNGIRNDVAPERFTSGDMVVAENVDIEKSGAASRRNGYTRRAVAAAVSSLWAQDSLGLFVAGTQLNRLNADFSSTPLGAVTAGRMSYCRPTDRVYFTNGVTTGVYDNGVVRTWGLPVPALPAASLTGGTIPPGTYQYVVTHSRADGQESGALQAGVIQVTAGSTILLGIPASTDPTVTTKNIYLSPPNGDMLYLAMSIPNALTSYTIFATDVSGLTLPLLTQFMQPAPAGQLVGHYKGRMFVAVGSILYMSEPFAHELFDPRNYIDLGSVVTMIAPFEDRLAPGLFIGTAQDTGVLLGDGPETFQYIPKLNYGVIPSTLVYAEGTLIGDGATGARQLPVWLSVHGICVGKPMMEIDNQTRGRCEIAASGNGAALFISEMNRFLAVTDSGAVTMRGENKAVSTYTNFAFNSFATFNGAYLGAKADGVYELVGDTDAGTPVAARIQFGITDFKSAFSKSIERAYVGYRSAGNLTLTVAIDSSSIVQSVLPTLLGDALHGSRVKLSKGLSGRYWQFSIQNTLGADFSLDVIDVVPTIRERREYA